MSFVLIYAVMIGKLQYFIMEPMADLNQCRRIKAVVESSESVHDAKCAAIILDTKE